MKTEKIKTGWKYGWPVGLAMFILLVVIPMIKEHTFDGALLAIQFVFWSIASIFLGLWIHYLLQRKKS